MEVVLEEMQLQGIW